MAKTFKEELVRGLWKEIPPFRLVLGLCPALAVTKTMADGFGMGVALIFVLVCSNAIISILKDLIPSKVRIACFIVIVATFVIVVELTMQAYAYPLYLSLGIFIPLIVVNCILLGRAEAFASKNPVLPSIADGLGIGLGFTMSLTVLGALRELISTGGLLGAKILPASYVPFKFVAEAPGAFLCLGLILALMNLIPTKK